jgi:hypothetical protein
MPRFRTALVALAFASGSAVAGDHHHHGHKHGAHVHGAAKLEVDVDGNALSIHLESPLANFIGFERAPKTDKERAAAKALLANLKQGERLFTPTPAAGCTLAEAAIEAPVLEGKAGDGHGDVDADYRFVCADPAKLKGLAVTLFKQYSGMSKIDAAVVTAKGQKAFKLSKKIHFMNW